MNFRTRRTRQKKIGSETRRSDLYFEAFVNTMQDSLGRLYFKDEQPVLIINIVVTDTYVKRVDVQYLLNSKTEECTVDTVEEFHEKFLTKEEYEERKVFRETLGLDEEVE